MFSFHVHLYCFVCVRVWEKLTEALKNRDQKAAGDCKFEVEEEQRTLRRSREERGEVWQPRYFTLAGDNMWMYNDIKYVVIFRT